MQLSKLRILTYAASQDSSSAVKNKLDQISAADLTIASTTVLDEAMTSIAEGKHDIYFVEVENNENGLRLIQHAQEPGCTSPVFGYSTNENHQEGVDCVAAGAIAYLIPEKMSAQQLERSILAALKQSQKERGLLEATQTANRAKTEFLANMIHEIRTPLNTIIGMTQLSLESEQSSEQREYAQVVQASSEALLSLTHDIIDLSKIEDGQLELEEMDFDLAHVVESVAEILGVRGVEKGIELLCFIDPVLPRWVIGDPKRLRQVLINLVSHAIKVTQRGEVSIRVLPKKSESEPETTGFHFMVCDTRAQIAAADSAYSATADREVELSTTRQANVAISIATSLVQMMGGHIWFENLDSDGMISHFTVPLQTVDNQLDERAVTRQESFQGVSVLVVDDNLNARFFLERSLQTWGFDVRSVARGADAVSHLMAADEPYRVVIVDQQLSDMTGAELVGAIRDNPKWAASRILMLQTWGSLHAQMSDDLDVDETILKPVKQSVLQDAIFRVLEEDETGDEENEVQQIVSSEVHDLGNVIGPRILVVDDNAEDLYSIKTELEGAGYSVDGAEDGQKAVHATQSGGYDLILMNIVMPSMDGFEATREIRVSERRIGSRRVPIIALTAYPFDGFRERCFQNDIDDYLTKPVLNIDLLNTVENWIEKTPSAVMPTATQTFQPK